MLCYVRTECDPIHAAFRSVSAHAQANFFVHLRLSPYIVVKNDIVMTPDICIKWATYKVDTSLSSQISITHLL